MTFLGTCVSLSSRLWGSPRLDPCGRRDPPRTFPLGSRLWGLPPSATLRRRLYLRQRLYTLPTHRVVGLLPS
jgi:hypothetical protein